ncbi:MAG: hypothetical protein ACR2P3_09000 [Geminicoccaceae bacterium]
MTLDVSEAIALAKDLLQTSGDFRPYDPALAAEFSDRAYEICDDLGIDRSLIGEAVADLVVEPAVEPVDDDVSSSPNATVEFEDDVEQTSQQLRSLLQQQADVLKNVRETEAQPKPKTKKRSRSFRLFGRSADSGIGRLQTA